MELRQELERSRSFGHVALQGYVDPLPLRRGALSHEAWRTSHHIVLIWRQGWQHVSTLIGSRQPEPLMCQDLTRYREACGLEYIGKQGMLNAFNRIWKADSAATIGVLVKLCGVYSYRLVKRVIQGA